MGHEMTHGFDDQGAQFDGTGKFSNWWTNSTLDNFHNRTACLADFFSQYEILPGVFIDGNLTLGENIADCGGIKQAFNAYKNYLNKFPVINGFNMNGAYFNWLTNDQLFFVAYAQGWCVKTTPEEARNRATTDVHSPGKFRVNGPVSQFPTFAQVFNCPPKSPMYPENTCDVW